MPSSCLVIGGQAGSSGTAGASGTAGTAGASGAAAASGAAFASLAAFASSPHLHSVGGQLPAPQLLTHQASEALLATLTHEAESRTVFTLGVYAAARPASSMSRGPS